MNLPRSRLMALWSLFTSRWNPQPPFLYLFDSQYHGVELSLMCCLFQKVSWNYSGSKSELPARRESQRRGATSAASRSDEILRSRLFSASSFFCYTILGVSLSNKLQVKLPHKFIQNCLARAHFEFKYPMLFADISDWWGWSCHNIIGQIKTFCSERSAENQNLNLRWIVRCRRKRSLLRVWSHNPGRSKDLSCSGALSI